MGDRDIYINKRCIPAIAIYCLNWRQNLSTTFFFLFRRAFDGAVGAEYAAIPFLRFQTGAAMGTLIKILTGIGRHGFFFFKTALRAFDD